MEYRDGMGWDGSIDVFSFPGGGGVRSTLVLSQATRPKGSICLPSNSKSSKTHGAFAVSCIK